MIAWTQLPEGQHRLSCPACGRGERDKTLGVTIGAGDGVAHCFRCHYVEYYRANSIRTPDVRRLSCLKLPCATKRTRLSDWGMGLWRDCSPLSGVAVEYLWHRRCALPPAHGDLRWHPVVKHPSGHTGPALVALVTDAATREPLSLHRTWITPTGKAKLDTPRLPLAGHSLHNGVIRLWPDDEVTTGLCVAEGIETALSAAWAYTPVWSVIDAGHLAKFPVLSGIETLLIAQDNDDAGIAAALACASRWHAAGVGVRITQQSANDLNDVLRKEMS